MTSNGGEFRVPRGQKGNPLNLRLGEIVFLGRGKPKSVTVSTGNPNDFAGLQFGQLRQLEVLDLSKNQITELPPSFGELRKLQTLRLADNPLTQLPRSFGNLQHLRELDLKNCPLGEVAVLSLDFDSGESRYLIQPSHDLTPQRLYERRWVLALLDQVLDSLRIELAELGKEPHFENLKGALIGEMTHSDYELAAEALGITCRGGATSSYEILRKQNCLLPGHGDAVWKVDTKPFHAFLKGTKR
jgi:hypothetical protein